MTFCSSVTIHLSGSIYVNIDSVINDQEASFKIRPYFEIPMEHLCHHLHPRATVLYRALSFYEQE